MQTSENLANIKLLIFDLDGTLYKIISPKFMGSAIYQDMRKNSIVFLSKKLGISEEEATKIFDRILVDYNKELSIGFEKEFGINRYEYFNNAWNLDTNKYMVRDEKLIKILNQLKKKYVLIVLTDAPKIWVERVLATRGVSEIFGSNVLTGESDIRKSFGNAFLLVAKKYGFAPQECMVIGDHKKNDIDFAKEVGMKTIYIGAEAYDKSDYSVKNIHDIAAILGVEK